MGFGGFMNQNPGYAGMTPLSGGRFGMMRGAGGSYAQGSPVFAPLYLHDFYANRMGALTPTNGRFGMHSFTDPAVSFGGGVQIRAGRHLVVRPDVRAVTAIADGGNRTIAVVSIGMGYGF
jgi:hypothetical protein